MIAVIAVRSRWIRDFFYGDGMWVYGFVLWVCDRGWICFGVEVRVVCGGLTKHKFMEIKGLVEQI